MARACSRYAEPRPVVNAIIVAPEATWPVALQGSKPGLSMNTEPAFGAPARAYSMTSLSGEVPAFATAPSDFSRMVVSPPALLPGEGLLFISAPLILV